MPAVSLNLPILSVGSSDNWPSNPPGTDKVVAVTDSSDSTYVFNNFASVSQHFNLGLPSIVNEIDGSITSISVTVRAKSTSGTSPLSLRLRRGGNATSTETRNFFAFESWTPYTFVFTTRPGGGAWNFSDLTDIVAEFGGTSGTSIQLTKVVAEVPANIDSYLLAPTSFSITGIDSNFVDLGWVDESDVEDGYEIQRSLDGITWETLVILSPDVEAYSDGTVSSVTEYFYRIRAFNSLGESDWSSVVSDTTPAYSGPALEPVNLNIVNLTPTSLELVWENGGASDSYTLQQSADGGTTWTTLATLPLTTKFYAISGRLPGSTYVYRIKASNTVGDSDWVESDDITFPERSFREFLQNEVLQDVVQTFGWYDRVKLPNQEFTVTQTFHASTNLSARDLTNPESSTVEYGAFPQAPLIGLYTLNWKQTNTVNISPPLVAELPVGTELFRKTGERFSLTDVDLVITVAQNPGHITPKGEVLVEGAAIGDTILFLNVQRVLAGTNTPIGPLQPYTMSGALSAFELGLYQAIGVVRQNVGMARPLSQYITVSTTVDYSVEPFDASPIYDAITDEALLKIGYSSEDEVPASEYQKFRDAGRVAAWRFVTYSAVHLSTTLISTDLAELGSVDRNQQLDQVFDTAFRQLQISEETYNARYGTVPTIPVGPVTKPRANTYNSGVTVRF